MPRMRNRFRTIHPVLHYTGLILVVLGILLLLPLLFVFFGGELRNGYETLTAFLVPAACSLTTGFVLRQLFREGALYTLRAVLICSLGWISCSAFGSIPYVLGTGTG